MSAERLRPSKTWMLLDFALAGQDLGRGFDAFTRHNTTDGWIQLAFAVIWLSLGFWFASMYDKSFETWIKRGKP